MKFIAGLFKVWVVLGVVAAIAITAAMWDGQPDVDVVFGGTTLQGPSAAVAAGAVGAFGVIIAGLIITLLVALIGIMVPLAVCFVLLIVLFGLGVAGAAVAGSVLLGLAPLLIPVALCVLLVRVLRRKRVAPVATHHADPAQAV